MIGAIAGDIIGSTFEWEPVKRKDFPLFVEGSRFTDDTVLTVAVADFLIGDAKTRPPMHTFFHDYYAWYPGAGYGRSFKNWARNRTVIPNGSFGNGSAMRVAPVGWVSSSATQAVQLAGATAEPTHSHPEGVKGAVAVAAAVFLARTTGSKDRVRAFIEDRVGYNLDRTVDEIRSGYKFDVTCQGSVPEAITCVLEADGYEDAVRNAVSLGGDADTQACIAGAIAEGFWGVPEEIRYLAMSYLDDRLIGVVNRFLERYMPEQAFECVADGNEGHGDC